MTLIKLIFQQQCFLEVKGTVHPRIHISQWNLKGSGIQSWRHSIHRNQKSLVYFCKICLVVINRDKMPSVTSKYLNNIHCRVCRRKVKLVPVQWMSWLCSQNFKKLIKAMLRCHQYFLCSLCCHWVYRTTILNTDYSGMSYCFVCRMKIIKPFAFLNNYDNPLFRPKEHIIDRRYVHHNCVALSEILRLVYVIIESDDWTLLKHIPGYKELTPYLCAPIVIPTKIPRPLGKMLIDHTLPKLQVDLGEIQNKMKWLCIKNSKAILV